MNDMETAARLVEACVRISALMARVAELEAANKKLSTPDYVGDGEEWYEVDDAQLHFDDGAQEVRVRQMWASRTLGKRWLVYLPSEDDADCWEVEVCETEADAEKMLGEGRVRMKRHDVDTLA